VDRRVLGFLGFEVVGRLIDGCLRVPTCGVCMSRVVGTRNSDGECGILDGHDV
jgi:hypothetical protein